MDFRVQVAAATYTDNLDVIRLKSFSKGVDALTNL